MNTDTLRAEMTVVENLLLEALSIERDLSRVLSECPQSRSVRKMRTEYSYIVDRLAMDYGMALNRYLKHLAATAQRSMEPADPRLAPVTAINSVGRAYSVRSAGAASNL